MSTNIQRHFSQPLAAPETGAPVTEKAEFVAKIVSIQTPNNGGGLSEIKNYIGAPKV